MSICRRHADPNGVPHLLRTLPSKNWGPVKPSIFFWKLGKRFNPPVPPKQQKGWGEGGVGRCTLCKKIGALIFLYVILAIFYLGPTCGCLSPTQISLGNLIPYKQSFFLLRLLFPKAKKNRTEERERKFFLAGT